MYKKKRDARDFWHQGSKEWRSGESARLPPVWLGFKCWRRRHVWVEFCCWFSHLLREVFLRVLRFSRLLKTQLFQIPIRPGIRQRRRTTWWMCYLQIIIYYLCTCKSFVLLIQSSFFAVLVAVVVAQS